MRRIAAYGAASTLSLYLLVKVDWVLAARVGRGPDEFDVSTTDWVILNTVTVGMAAIGIAPPAMRLAPRSRQVGTITRVRGVATPTTGELASWFARCDAGIAWDMPSAPVRVATVGWSVAVAAGVVESALAVAQLAAHGQLTAGAWANIGLRVVVYALAMLLVVQFSRGRRWARLALTVLVTVIGLGTLVVPAVAALADGQTLVAALSDGGKLGWAFVTVRLLHIACVLTASVAMYLPSANRFFTSARRAAVPAR